MFESEKMEGRKYGCDQGSRLMKDGNLPYLQMEVSLLSLLIQMAEVIDNEGRMTALFNFVSKLKFPFPTTNVEKLRQESSPLQLPRQIKKYSSVITQTDHQKDAADQENNETKGEADDEDCSWVINFLSANYFHDCEKHKNDDNGGKFKLSYFCRDCPEAGPLCESCIDEHHSQHRVLKLGKRMKNDVIRAPESYFFDTTDIYPYMSGNAESVYCLRSDKPIISSPPPNKCIVCRKPFIGRKLKVGKKRMKAKDKLAIVTMEKQRQSAQFCSLMCKLRHLSESGMPTQYLLNYDHKDGSGDEKEVIDLELLQRKVGSAKKKVAQRKGFTQKRTRMKSMVSDNDEDTDVDEQYEEDGDTEDQEESAEIETEDGLDMNNTKDEESVVSERKRSSYWENKSVYSVDEKPHVIEMDFPNQNHDISDEESPSKRRKTDPSENEKQTHTNKYKIDDNMKRLKKLLDAKV